MALGYKGPKPKAPPRNPFPVLVFPSSGSMETIETLKRLKYLTDQFVCWMHEHGYSQVSIEIRSSSVIVPGDYRLSLKTD